MQPHRRWERQARVKPMRSAARLLLALVFVALATALPQADVAACSCAGFGGAQEAVAAAEIAFTGTVVDSRPSGIVSEFGDIKDTAYAFEVDGVAKGEVGPEAIVIAGGSGASCGMTFGQGERWFVLASREGGFLTTNLCAGSEPLAEGEAAPVPVHAPAGDPDAGGDSGLSVPTPLLLALAALALVAAISAWAFRRRSHG